LRPKLDSYTQSPIIGLEYLVEISGSRLEDPVFKCLLCQTTFGEVSASLNSFCVADVAIK
jgi:hypothetical protein